LIRQNEKLTVDNNSLIDYLAKSDEERERLLTDLSQTKSELGSSVIFIRKMNYS